MGRPGFVLDVDGRTPPLLMHEGEGFRLERLPLGSRVIYPPESLPTIVDLERAIRHALAHPHGSDPLPQLLHRGMRLTVVFDDLSLPLPPMRTPDVRQRVIEQVLEMAAAAGVDDVELIAANSLHRRMTPAELNRTVGERVFRAFHPAHLRNHDAEDPNGLMYLGTTAHGEDVEINRRAAESDLIVYVNITLTAMNGGSKSVSVGLASYASLRHHHNVHTLRHSRSFNDPPNSAMHHSYDRTADLIGGHVPVFTIETTLNNEPSPRCASSPVASGSGTSPTRPATWRSNGATTWPSPRCGGGSGRPPRRPTASPECTPAHRPRCTRTLWLAVHRQQLTEVDGQADVAIFGLPYICPYNVNSIMNPILVMSLGLGYFFNLYRGKPIVRQGGVAIFYHPMPPEFHPVHHPSYIDFYELLAETTDPVVLEAKYEKQFATDPWYTHLYRTRLVRAVATLWAEDDLGWYRALRAAADDSLALPTGSRSVLPTTAAGQPAQDDMAPWRRVWEATRPPADDRPRQVWTD